MKIPFSPPRLIDSDRRAVEEVLKSGWITTGPKVNEFEKMNLITLLLEKEIRDKAVVDEADVRAAYDANPERYQKDASFSYWSPRTSTGPSVPSTKISFRFTW